MKPAPTQPCGTWTAMATGWAMSATANLLARSHQATWPTAATIVTMRQPATMTTAATETAPMPACGIWTPMVTTLAMPATANPPAHNLQAMWPTAVTIVTTPPPAIMTVLEEATLHVITSVPAWTTSPSNWMHQDLHHWVMTTILQNPIFLGSLDTGGLKPEVKLKMKPAIGATSISTVPSSPMGNSTWMRGLTYTQMYTPATSLERKPWSPG